MYIVTNLATDCRDRYYDNKLISIHGLNSKMSYSIEYTALCDCHFTLADTNDFSKVIEVHGFDIRKYIDNLIGYFVVDISGESDEVFIFSRDEWELGKVLEFNRVERLSSEIKDSSYLSDLDVLDYRLINTTFNGLYYHEGYLYDRDCWEARIKRKLCPITAFILFGIFHFGEMRMNSEYLYLPFSNMEYIVFRIIDKVKLAKFLFKIRGGR